MNKPSTRFPDAPKLDTVLITRVGPNGGYAFGLASDGLAVFISSGLTKRLGVTPGDRVEGSIVPNHARPEHTPWYLHAGVVVAGGERRARDVETLVGALTAEGGAWEAEDMLDVFAPGGADKVRVVAALETAHMTKRVSKIVMFDHRSDERRVWYTVYPDRIDVDEFENEGE